MKLAESDSTIEPDEPTVYFVTITVGPVAVQLAGSAIPTLTFDDIAFPQLEVARIWPPSGRVYYRHRVAMTHKTLLVFSTALYEDLSTRSDPPLPPAR